MITLVSDLHLSDTAARSTINVARLLNYLAGAFREAREKKVREIRLILLGDIFEVLKSEVWLERGVRPWEKATPAHQAAVAEIVGKIIGANASFFDGVNGLLREHEGRLRLQYVTGNHDRPLNKKVSMGAGARALLQSALPALASGPDGLDQFTDGLFDPEHRLVAEHGHEFDPANRYEAGLAAVGDAVVIEFVLGLPLAVRRELGADEDDPRLDFLYELDNVRPHSPSVLVQWIESNLSSDPGVGPRVNDAIPKALSTVLSNFIALKRGGVRFGSFEGIERRVEWLMQVLKHSSENYRRLADLFPEDEAAPYHSLALDRLRSLHDLGSEWRYFVCGHTHDPMLHPVDLGEDSADRVCVYFNTGTWRRVRRVASGAPQGVRAKAFSCWEEQCVVNIYSPGDQGLGCPPYEFHRVTSGAYV
jgi:UDP-2,3-diacylglucosamine pyrophosphatase LpxH